MKKKRIIIGSGALLSVILCVVAWNVWFGVTNVAFINYQVINLGQISKANDNSFIKITALETDDIDNITSYDMVFMNAMGLRITEEQRAVIEDAAYNGIPILTTAATNPANNITSLDSVQVEDLRKYLTNGGRRNYRSMLNYVRKYIDGKIISVKEPEPATLRSNDMFYHADPKNPDEEELGFNTIKDYNAFLADNGLYLLNAPCVVVTGQMGEPTELIKKLEETGNNVYPVRNMRAFIGSGMADSVNVSAVINMAHGRMGDYIVDYLKEKNIPLFAPLNVNRLVEEWENDKLGMSGGFMSQSIVTPEIDGAIRPYALFGHYKDEEGLQHAYAIPERLETFVETVNNYIGLKNKPNAEKRVAIYYYKGPGQNAMTAGGMEVCSSLYNLLKRMKQEGYRVNLPASVDELSRLIQAQGAVFGNYAEGAYSDFMKNGNPVLVTKEQYEEWVNKALRPEKYAEAVAVNGEFPGDYMVSDDGRLGVARVDLGNVVLLPQNAAGNGDNSFKVVHGTDAAPPHAYIASYLWTQYGFCADVLIHFGTHGSLEFTPRKQVALSNNDWSDRLVGAMPHLYVYSIGNVGEGVIAKRRSYAGLQSYLTPPFMESNVRGIYKELNKAIKAYNNSLGDGEALTDAQKAVLERNSLAVKKTAVKMGIHRELSLDSVMSIPYTEEEIMRIETFAEELANEKVTGQLYTMGVPYSSERIKSSVYAMTVEPVAYSLLALDKQRNKVKGDVEKHKSVFTARYLNPARDLVTRLLVDSDAASDELICHIAGITAGELAKAREIDASRKAPQGMMAMMMAMSGANSSPHAVAVSPKKTKKTSVALEMAKSFGASEEQLKKMETAMMKKEQKGKSSVETKPKSAHASGKMAEMIENSIQKKEYSKEEINFSVAVMEVERTIKNVHNYKKALLESPERELESLINAMNGGYTAPSAGGDPVANPNTLPTGRNLYAINAEATPSESAWEKGVQLANNTIEMYKKRHNDSIPHKVSYTLWSGEFIETEGATIAQVLYMLGVEPIRDAFGRVTDLRLIPSKELGRPRIDVVVQTSGQLRDIAASRLFLINRAVEMAAAAKDDEYENQVAASAVEAERRLIEKGLSPKEAREISTFRVFGGVNGNYGTGIQGMVQSGDRWENESEIADVYLNNMGAFYGSEKNWEAVRQYAFEAALSNTDAVIQPRQSNTWGALSLDHVYEFMGGMNLAVRSVTGKDPDAYLSDYRNRNKARMQEVKEAIGVESRTTIFNPEYIKEKMKGEAGSANTFAEIIQNTYGWNVMKPKAVDNEMWDEIYNVYVKDKFGLGVKNYFETGNPAALEEMTAVMMETARKGMWKATDEQLADIAKLHTELVNKYKPSCSGFVCDNAKLRDFIASKADENAADEYKQNIKEIRESSISGEKKGMVMKKEELVQDDKVTTVLNNVIVGAIVVGAIVILILLVRHRRKKMQE